MIPKVVKLPGAKAGYAVAIHVNNVHVATVADPESGSRESAMAVAYEWERTYQKILTRSV